MVNIDNNNLLSVNTSFNNATIDLTSEDIVTNNTKKIKGFDVCF